MLVAVALATLVLGQASASQKPADADSLTAIFSTYCQLAPGDTQPYCAADAPANVQWLALYSLCSAKEPDAATESAAAKTWATYAPVCTRFATFVASDNAAHDFLTYNPRTDTWAAAVFTKAPAKGCGTAKGDPKEWYCRTSDAAWLDITETGLATVTRAASDDIPVLISGVNPLIYGTTPVTVTSEDIEALASLQQIALGLGGVLTKGIGFWARGNLDNRTFMAMRNNDPNFKDPDRLEPPPQQLTRVLTERDRRLELMVDASRNLAGAAGAIDIARSQALVSIQEAEQAMARPGLALTATIRPVDPAEAAYGTLQKAYTQLDSAYREVRDHGEACRPLLREFLFIVEHEDGPADHLRDYLKTFLAKPNAHGKCGDDFNALAAKALDDARALAAIAGDTAFLTQVKKLNTQYNAGLKVALNPPPADEAESGAKDKPVAPLDAALDLLTTKRNTGLVAYNALVTAGMRRQNYCFADVRMMTWLYVAPKTDQLPWTKVQTHTFSLKKNAPLSSGVTASLPEDTSLKYKLQSSKTTGLGVGVGVIYTSLSQPKFDAVTDPANKDQKVISQTDSDTLAGQLALFADWRIASAFKRSAEKWVFRPSLQVGTNISTTPGFFTGIGIDMFKYFRFGWGRTWQQSKRLSPTQTLNTTVVASATDIKTEDFFDKGTYYSFSFALDSLPLFKKSDAGSGAEKAKPAAEAEGGDAAAAEAAKKKKAAGGQQ